MPIVVQPRGAPSTCPYCKDEVEGGVACPRCAGRYHEECASIYGLCATLACGGELPGKRGALAPLQRLKVLAHRIGLGRWPTEGLRPDGPFAVALFPAAREVETRREAVELVADLLGQTAFDARLRLASNAPEPLVRADARADAEDVVWRLAAVGLPARALPMLELVRPLAHLPVEGLVAGAGGSLTLLGAQGKARPLPADRLVVTAPLVEVRRRAELRTASYDATGTARRRATTRERRGKDPAAFIFSPGDPVPALVVASGLRTLEGMRREPIAAQTWKHVQRALAAPPASHVELELGGDDAFLSMRWPGMATQSEQVLDNHRAVELAARLCWWAWKESRATKGSA